MKSCLLLLAFSTALAAQALDGNVVDGVTGEPVEGAYVGTYSKEGAALSARTDAAGRFRFEEVTPWATFEVRRCGYRFTRWQLPRQASPPSDQSTSALRITLTPDAIISGKVVDEEGTPAGDALLRLLHYQFVNGERRLVEVMTRPGAGTRSDDLGQFRLSGLLPGRYIIQVLPNDLGNWDGRYVPKFFPGGLEPGDKSLFEVKAGQELSDVELRLTRYEGVTVSGQVLTQDGAPALANGTVSLSQPDNPGSYSSGRRMSDGSFSIWHVRPGNYTLRFRSGSYPPKAGDLLAEQQLQVGGSDISGLALTAHEIRAVDLTGTVVLEGEGALRPLIIEARTDFGTGATSRSDEGGAFALKGMLPGHYLIQVTPVTRPAVAFPVSIRLGEKEVLNEGFDLDGPPTGPLLLTLSTGSSGASSFRARGTLLDASGLPVAGARLMLLSTAQPATQIWAETDSNGVFSPVATVGGEYRVIIAPDQGQADLLSDADFVEAHQADYPPIRLIEGDGLAFTLKIPPPAPR